jgi:diguanylate cyclase (GGDEF)-like protein
VWLRRQAGADIPARAGEDVLVRIALALAESTTVEGALDTLARELTSTVARASECTISTWDPVGDQLVTAAVAYAEQWPEEEERGKRYPLDDYPGLRDLLHQRTGYVQYRASDDGLPRRVQTQLAEWKWQTWVAFPLVVGGDAVGIIEVVDYRSTAPWTPVDVRFCQALATLAAVSVRNAQLVSELRELADRDPLTGLLNHRAFYEALELKHARCLEAGEQLAVLVADIDDFKAHNDEYGHLHGDESLRRVARALIQLTRSGDIAGRIGGDEFALALPNTSGADIEAIAQRLITGLQDTAGLSASVGVTLNPTSSQSFLDIVELADDALRVAKRSGKRGVRIADAA